MHQRTLVTLLSIVAMAFCCGSRALVAADDPIEQAHIFVSGQPAPLASSDATGLRIVAGPSGPQIAVFDRGMTCVASLKSNEVVDVRVPLKDYREPIAVSVDAQLVHGTQADIRLILDGSEPCRVSLGRKVVRLEVNSTADARPREIRLETRCGSGDASVRWRNLTLTTGDRVIDVPIKLPAMDLAAGLSARLPPLRKPIEDVLIQWDWRMQDGIGTERAPSTYLAATRRTLERGDALLRDLGDAGNDVAQPSGKWRELWQRFRQLGPSSPPSEREALWLQVHQLRREIALRNPLANTGPLVFVKQAPSSFSHQLTQYAGRHARPGGGVFILEAPGQGMSCRELTAGKLVRGSYQHCEVSYDGKRILFAFCAAEDVPPPGIDGHLGRRFHLYEINADGSNLRQLTDGDDDDFCGRYLPNGQIVFVSTRRGGWHRCGGSPGHGCENFTLALVNGDGSDPHPISFHETQEWDPAVLDDGRVIYTRWDYVDRHAVYYEQLWVTHPDGSAPAIFFGNNTFNPVGIWEARPVPGSSRVMATAGAHHAMTAGSIILVDVNHAVDGPSAITRLTPDALFPESETHVAPRGWHAPAGVNHPPTVPIDEKRWPGHCYRSPYPLSEKYFLAAYSFDPLIGEPDANRPNMFGIYLVDAFGNKELLYRDPNISSLWPMPLRSRPRPADVSTLYAASQKAQGTFFLQDVYQSQPPLPKGSIDRLRIVQVLPKTTAGINNPPVGLPNASPGKQVLGTVPVESDGSALFRAPAGIPLSFQALDAQGRAVQIMRSVTYLQPGEVVSCVGCHESRTSTPPPGTMALALRRQPSTIKPAPDGANPLSYPLLVQGVLDRHCVRCHNPQRAEGAVILTGEPEGRYTRSYNALAPRVTFSAWGGRNGDFRQVNSEPLSRPGFFGALGSPALLGVLNDHYQVKLSSEDRERLFTWMDANALFYGTFDPADQARQLRGERIAGPRLQ